MLKIELSPGAQRLLKNNPETHVKKVLNEVLEASARELNETIKMPGMAPQTHGDFARSHMVVSTPNSKYIINPLCASDGTPLWKYITGGHRTLTTEASRRWWFQHLKNDLGENYNRKTHGPSGYVPPDNYPRRALESIRGRFPTSKMKKL